MTREVGKPCDKQQENSKTWGKTDNMGLELLSRHSLEVKCIFQLLSTVSSKLKDPEPLDS